MAKVRYTWTSVPAPGAGESAVDRLRAEISYDGASTFQLVDDTIPANSLEYTFDNVTAGLVTVSIRSVDADDRVSARLTRAHTAAEVTPPAPQGPVTSENV